MKRFRQYSLNDPVQGWLWQTGILFAVNMGLLLLICFLFHERPTPRLFPMIMWPLASPSMTLVRRCSTKASPDEIVSPSQKWRVAVLAVTLAVGTILLELGAALSKTLGLSLSGDIGPACCLSFANLTVISLIVSFAVRDTRLGRTAMILAVSSLITCFPVALATLLSR